jgi:N-methylhydantoinase B/oxoprolinase/acetone carboxylase alpha subunit
MGRKTERKDLGLRIKISSHRKHGNGGVGGGRKGSTGKKAEVTRKGTESVTITGSSTTDLLRKVRNRFSIPSNYKINDKGETII